MRWPNFRRARSFGRTLSDRVWLDTVAICAALLLPLLIWDLGLIVQLIFGSQSSVIPRDWILGPWISGAVVSWPLFGDEQRCLFALLAFGIAVGGLEVWALWLLNRSVQHAASQVVTGFKREIHRQAYQLGSIDLLGGRRSRPEQLFGETTEVLRCGLVRWWSAVPYAAVALAVLVLMALMVNVWLALVVVLALILVRQVYTGVRSRATARFARQCQEVDAAHRQLMENLRLTPLATGYALPDAPGRSFAEMLGDFERAFLDGRNRLASLGPALLMMVLLVVAYTILVVGLSHRATVAGTAVLTIAIIGAYFPAARLYRIRGSLAEAEAAATDLFAFLRREPGVRELKNARQLDRVARSVRLEEVTLADSDGVKLLDHVSLEIEAGRRAAILASDPHVSMALAGLFVRLYDPAAGRVLFDDQDIAEATLDTVRGQALLVPADGMLFEGTVNENIACGDAGFTTLQITDAAKQARAHNFIMELPQGFGTVIGGNSRPLNSSQAFRIGLARALLRDPNVLVVMEPQNDLDEASSGYLDEAIRLATAERTAIVLPGRLSTLRSMDKVLLIHEGKLHAEGAHADLLQTSELYRHLNYVRFHAFREIH